MLILAFESSAKHVSAAVYEQSDDGGKLLGQRFQNDGRSHSRTLLELARVLLDSLGLKPGDIGLFAVASGPGSFTGVRVSVSAVKGLAFGLDVPVCGVSTLEAMARQSTNIVSDGAFICPVMDARRNHVYNAIFKRNGSGIKRLREDRAISIEDLVSDLKTISQIQTQNPLCKNPVLLVGDGADLVFSLLSEDSGLTLTVADFDKKYQSAYGVALAALHAKPVAAAELEPVYLRPSQAERMLRSARMGESSL